MRTNIFKKIFVVVLTITLAFSFVACGETKDDSSGSICEINSNSSSSCDYDDFDDGRTSDNSVSIDFDEKKGNMFLSAKEVIAEGNHSQVTVDSWYDDDNYCYIVYLGRIKNFILYDLYTFEYTDAMSVLGGFNVSLKQVEQTTIENTYSNTVTKSIENKVSMAITNSLSSTTSASVNGLGNKTFGTEMNNTLEMHLQQTWKTNCTETNSEVYTTITSQTNEMIQSFTIDYSKCEEGTFYSFASVTDVDVYVAMSYNPQNASVQYKYYTDVLGRARMAAFSSSDGSFLYDNDALEIDTSDFSFVKPQKYITNHPQKSHSKTGGTGIKISSGHTSIWRYIFSEESLLNDYSQKGYDMVKISFSFNYTRKGDAQLHFSIIGTAGKNDNFYQLNTKDEGVKNGSITLSFQQCKDCSGFDFKFKNNNLFNSYNIYDLSMTLTFYCSRAKY